MSESKWTDDAWLVWFLLAVLLFSDCNDLVRHNALRERVRQLEQKENIK